MFIFKLDANLLPSSLMTKTSVLFSFLIIFHFYSSKNYADFGLKLEMRQ